LQLTVTSAPQAKSVVMLKVTDPDATVSTQGSPASGNNFPSDPMYIKSPSTACKSVLISSPDSLEAQRELTINFLKLHLQASFG